MAECLRCFQRGACCSKVSRSYLPPTPVLGKAPLGENTGIWDKTVNTERKEEKHLIT